MINVLLVEDHELYRMGLSMLLEKADGITLCAEAADGADGIKKARELNPDVILMDIGLPNIDGIEATGRIKDFNPDVKILIFTSRDSDNDVFEAFKAGADGYIMKGATPEQTISAIKSVYELLNLITFITAGEKEVHAWTITRGTKAPQAAGVIHTDFEKGFIRAEVTGYNDFVQNGSYTACKDKGCLLYTSPSPRDCS